LLGQHDRPIANVELCTMVSDSNTQGKAEGITEPLNSLAHIRISKFWDDSAPWHGPVR
jgi:hypothetical protein